MNLNMNHFEMCEKNNSAAFHNYNYDLTVASQPWRFTKIVCFVKCSSVIES